MNLVKNDQVTLKNCHISRSLCFACIATTTAISEVCHQLNQVLMGYWIFWSPVRQTPCNKMKGGIGKQRMKECTKLVVLARFKAKESEREQDKSTWCTSNEEKDERRLHVTGL